VAIVVLSGSLSFAQVPERIVYQGRLISSGELVTDTLSMTVRLYTHERDGEKVFEEGHSVSVEDGLYAVTIGENAGGAALKGGLTRGGEWLEIEVNGTILEPRHRLSSVAYALYAGALPSGALTSGMIAEGAVDAAAIAAGVITTNHLAVALRNALGGPRVEAGSESLTNTGHFPTDSSVSITFDQAFSSPPTVSATLQGLYGVGNGAVHLMSATTTSATFQVSGLGASTRQEPVSIVDGQGEVHIWGLEVVNGRLALAYSTDSPRKRWYVSATDAEGQAWDTPTDLGTIGSDNEGAMILHEDMPMAFWDGASGVEHARGLQWGTSWTVPISVSNLTHLIEPCIVAGHPAAAFFESSSVRYARAHDAQGFVWPVTLSLDNLWHAGVAFDLAVVEGRPAIAYETARDGIHFVRALDAFGDAWGATTQVYNSSVADVALRVVDGRPCVAIATGSDLYFVRASNEVGSAWLSARELSSEDADAVDLHVVSGYPVVAFTGSEGVFTRTATDTSGTAWAPVEQVAYGAPDSTIALTALGNRTVVAYVLEDESRLNVAVGAAPLPDTLFRSPVVVDTYGGAGLNPSPLMVNGRPAIAYRIASASRLFYVRAQDTVGDTWGGRQQVGSNRDGHYASMAIVDGRPAIAHYYSDGGDLRYVRALDANGDSWVATTNVSTQYDVGQYASLAVVNGYPSIGFYDSDAGDVGFVQANDAEGTSWGAVYWPATGGDVGRYTSLAEVDGRPALAYYDATQNVLRYARAHNAGGTMWPVAPHAAIETNVAVGSYITLAVIDGRPCVAYLDDGRDLVKFSRGLDAHGGAWSPPLVVPVGRDTIDHVRMGIVAGRPAIVCHDTAATSLLYLEAWSSDGAAWADPVTVNDRNVGMYPAVIDVGGDPGIAYYDMRNTALVYSRRTANPIRLNWIAVGP